MHESSRAFLTSLLHTPSPSGYERPVQDLVRGWAKPLADEVRTDRHGNVIAAVNPGGSPRIMLAGHCDQIALMVQLIDESGFLYVQPIGGWDMQILLGQNLTVWTREGPVAGVVSRKAPHLMTNEERKKVPDFHDVWVDIGARDRKDAESLVSPGDPVTFDLVCRDMRNNLVTSPGLDDKVGVWTVMETLRLLRGRPMKAAVFCVSTVQEEIGLRGATTSAYGIHPALGIAVDVCHAADTPSNDKKQLGETKLGNGPVVFRGPNINPHVFSRLHHLATAGNIPIQVRGAPRATGTDANAIQLNREGVATGVIGIPNRYMHSPVEVVSLDDLDHAARLLAEFCASISPQCDWVP
ncbi:MAG: M42 family metallopeptidase [Planctomycetes bacterium]|nr:M42 family metallopeptidase [Planctomycetota bacterium]